MSTRGYHLVMYRRGINVIRCDGISIGKRVYLSDQQLWFVCVGNLERMHGQETVNTGYKYFI